MRPWLIALAAGLLALGPAGAQGADLYVATTGNDAWSGHLDTPNEAGTDGPFATLARARDAIRALKKGPGLPPGGITVWIGEGTYYLTEPLKLTAEDSGTKESPVTYRAREGEDVWLSGGRAIEPAQVRPVTDQAVLGRLDESARGQVVQVDLRAVGVGYLPELPESFFGSTRRYPIMLEVFSGDDRMTLARWPNGGFARWSEIVDTGSGLRDPTGPKRPGRVSYEGDRPARWDVDEGVWLLGYWARAYTCEVVKAGVIDTAKHEIELAVPMHYGLDTWGAKRYFAMNVLEELDTAGEWFLDRTRGMLYLWPPAPVADHPLTVSVLDQPIVSMRDASYITLRGLGLECGRLDAVSISGGDHNRVVGCTIRNVGRHGVEIVGGTDHGVVGCDIHHVGYAGVILNGGDRQTLTPSNHYAVNNHIHHTSVIRRTHAGALQLRGVGTRAAHNLIHHEPHSAVWYWGNDHLMEYNEIYWVHTETTEGGVFYTGRDWTTRGNVIRYNYIHHINDSLEGSPTSVNVVHLDDCVAGTSFIGNLCYRVGRGVSICGGPDNIVENNAFVNCKLAVDLQDRGLRWWDWKRSPDGQVTAIDTRSGREGSVLLSRLLKVPYNQPPYTKYPHLADMLDRDPVAAPWYCRIERNISVGGRFLTVGKLVKPEWVTIENNWDEGDPGLVDPERGDFRLKDDAPARATGFEPLPLDQIGLIDDDTRASWPVTPEPPPADWKPRWMVLREQEERMPGALPVFAVKHASAAITIDGTVDPKEWDPGEAAGVIAESYEVAQLEWGVDGQKSPRPSRAWLETDDQHLYVAFVNDVDPAVGVSGGQQWGQDDAVEIALAAISDDGVGDIIVLRGYANGQFESSDEAGAPRTVVKRAMEDVAYAAKIVNPGQWTAEWRIPFASLGVDPGLRNPRLLFNLSVRKPAGDLWVMWKKTGGYTWEVRRSGFLWLSAFGDVLFSGGIPSQARIDIDGRADGVTMKPVAGCVAATWVKPTGVRLTGSTDDLPSDAWRDFEVAFIPEKDGVVTLNLMGRHHTSQIDGTLVPIWVYFDDFTVEGAELRNGGFEEPGDKGLPAGWRNELSKAFWIEDAKSACTGERCVKVWHNGRFTQNLTVRQGRQVTIRAKVRGEFSE